MDIYGYHEPYVLDRLRASYADADGYAPDRAFSTADLSEECKLSRNHLAKIMQHPDRGKFVETCRDLNGGSVLCRESSEKLDRRRSAAAREL